MATEFPFSAKILAIIFFTLFKRVCLWVVKFGQWRKKWTVDCISFPQLHKGSTESWKLYLNLCFFKWLKPILKRVRSFSPNGLFMLKTLLEFGLMKFNKCFLKMQNCKFQDEACSTHLLLMQKTYFWRNYDIFEEIMSNFIRVSGRVHSTTTWCWIK